MSSMFYIKAMILELKNKLRAVRVTQGDLTQQELADQVGCSRQTIISVESSKFVPSVELALKIAHILKSKVEDIFYLEMDAPSTENKIEKTQKGTK